MTFQDCIRRQAADGLVTLADLIDAGVAWHELDVSKRDGKVVTLAGPATALVVRIVEVTTSDEGTYSRVGDVVARVVLDRPTQTDPAAEVTDGCIQRNPTGVYTIRDGMVLRVPFARAFVQLHLSTALQSAITTGDARVVIGWGLCVAPEANSRRPVLVEDVATVEAAGGYSSGQTSASSSGTLIIPDTATSWTVWNLSSTRQAGISFGAVANYTNREGQLPPYGRLSSDMGLPTGTEIYVAGDAGTLPVGYVHT